MPMPARFESLEPRLLLSAEPSLPTAIEWFNASPAVFVENQGQWQDDSLRYAFEGSGMNIAFTDAGPVFHVYESEQTDLEEVTDFGAELEDLPWAMEDLLHDQADVPPMRTTSFSVTFDGAGRVRPVGLDANESRFNYLVGEPSQHREGVQGYETILYESLYAGIDLYTWGQRDSLKYEFRVDPGVDYTQVQVSYEGIGGLSIAEDGSLVVDLGEGWDPLIDAAPYVYQEIDGQQVVVESRYVLLDEDTYGFELLGEYDATKVLVLDPDLAWSSYLGGSGDDHGRGIAVDGAGGVYVVGSTRSSGWTSGGYDTTDNGSYDVFVAKLTSSGGHAWSTYLGGVYTDEGSGIAVDAAGGVYVTGYTVSSGWTSGGYDTTYNGGQDAFAVKLTSSGGHAWSTYLGGSNRERGFGISADGTGGVYVTGDTQSSGWTSGGYDTTYSGGEDAFVVKLTSSGGHAWSTYLGGSGSDGGNGIAADGTGGVYLTGYTNSSGWTSGGYDTTYSGGQDAFVVKLTSLGGHTWSTYLGGSSIEEGRGIAVDGTGVYVTGDTQSTGWTSGGYDTTHNGNQDAFVAKLTSSGGHGWSTYLGGSSSDGGNGIAVDGTGGVYVTGWTDSSGWISGGYDTMYNGGRDPFVAKLTSTSGHVWGTYLGGSGSDFSRGISADGTGGVYVTGHTNSSGWTSGGYDTAYSGNRDAFVAKINDPIDPIPPGVTIITHGWQRQVFDNPAAPPDWAIEMANAITDRANGGRVYSNGYDPEQPNYGDWILSSNTGSNEIVLVYNWVWDSSDSEQGWLEAAADNLFASLIEAPLGINILNEKLHFIGHSRGAVVNSLVVGLFDKYFSNYVIDQVTSLDPHPILAGVGAGAFVEEDDSWINTYNNVRYADNYYRVDPDGYQPWNFDFSGVSVQGAWNLRLAESALHGSGHALEHSDVHNWYRGTIHESLDTSMDFAGTNVTTTMLNTWWSSGAYESVNDVAGVNPGDRTQVGYNQSRVGGLDRSDFENNLLGSRINHTSHPAFQTGGFYATPVFNGTFDYGDAFVLVDEDEIPGWQRHGGSSNVDLTGDANIHFGETGGNNYTEIRHNPLYFPADAQSLTFDYQVTNPSADDILRVYINDDLVSNIALNETISGSKSIGVFSYRDTVGTIRFKLDYGTLITSDVVVDNVDLVLTTNASPAISSLSDSPSNVIRGNTLTLTANASDSDGSVTQVWFYHDSNGNGSYDVADTLLGTDSNISGGWTWSGSTAGFPLGINRFFAQAQDNDGAWSNVVSDLGLVSNALPTISSLSDSPSTVTRPDNLTLTANGVGDPDGSVSQVEFYLDSNNNSTLEVGTDTLLGTDTSSSGGWAWSGSTGSFPLGTNRYFAQAMDNDGALSSVVTTTGTVDDASVVGDFDGDGDIDGVDIGEMFANFNGPGGGVPTNPATDMDADGDVDGVDLATLFGLFTGPLSPAASDVSSEDRTLEQQAVSGMLYDQQQQTQQSTHSASFSLFELDEREDDGGLGTDYDAMSERLLSIV